MTSFLSSAIYGTPGAQCSLRQDETQAPGAAFAKMCQETSASLRRRGSPCPVASTSDTVSQGSQTSRIRDDGFRTASRRIEEAFAGALGGAAAWARRTSRRRGLLAEGFAAAAPPPVRIPCDSPRAALSPVPAPQPTSGRFGDVVVRQRF